MHLLQAILLSIPLFTINCACSFRPNPTAMNTIRYSVENRCIPAVVDFMQFLSAAESIPELVPLLDIQGEVKDFLDSTCRGRVNHPQCDVMSSNENNFGQCMFKDARILEHCAITSVQPSGRSGNCTLDLKCWYAGSGHKFVNLLQEYDPMSGYSYQLTTHNTLPKFFKVPEQ